jgi:PAS domain S-box-containing protein
MNLENIFVQVPTYIFWKDLHSVFLGCNYHFARAAGLYSPEEIIGKTDFDLIWGESHAEYYQNGDQEVLAGLHKHNVIETQVRDDDQLVNILITKIPLLDTDGQMIGVIGSYSDLIDINYCGMQKNMKNNITLSPKQADCLVYVAMGMTAKQIAEAMNLSIRTVQHYIENIKVKLNCWTKSALIKKALTIDIIRARLLARGSL